MVYRPLRILSVLAFSLLYASSALADGREGQEESDSYLSESETSYTGAIMLEGELDISIDPVLPGSIGEEGDQRYAFFVGNTLYAGVEDEEGNLVDLIGEFFWFESSIDRGSDFYVGVFKVRTSPALIDGWRLQQGDPVLYLSAETDLNAQTGSFRWDWSVPFESYGYDSYGAVTMETEYGMGVGSEGAILAGAGFDEDGVAVSGEIQTKGYMNSEYSVRTQYQVTLWRWEVIVSGAAGHIDWAMLLNNGDREDQNAYHEFFLVMQADERTPFVIDNLEFGGSAKDPVPLWWDHSADMSVVVPNIVLNRPIIPEPDPPEDDPGDDDEVEDGGWWPGDDEHVPWNDPADEDTDWSDASGGSCASASNGCAIATTPSGAPGAALFTFLLVGLAWRRTRQ